MNTEDAEDTAFYEINRRLPDETEDRIIHGTIDNNFAGEILGVYADYDKEDNERLYYMSMFFDELWFSFPVPFKRGDIVSLCNRYHPEDRDPIVVDGIMLEEYLSTAVPALYTKEGLKLAGFPVEGDE